MKLYTEEQVRKAFGFWFDSSRIWTQDDVLRELTPIELPSDEEIKQEAERLYPLTGHVGIDHRNHLRKKGFIDGMEWMRDKIGGNNEQR